MGENWFVNLVLILISVNTTLKISKYGLVICRQSADPLDGDVRKQSERGRKKNCSPLFSKQNTTVDMSELNEIGAAIISLTEFPVMLEN